MAGRWFEVLTGSLDEKRQYRQVRARIAALPTSHGMAARALERYLLHFGAIARGDVLVRMLEDLVELFEQSAADGVPVADVVGDDPVEFAETFMQNYSDGQWINKERARLSSAIERASAQEHEGGDGA